MTVDLAQQTLDESLLIQKHYDFLYDLYTEYVSIPDLIVIAQRDLTLPVERRAVCEMLINVVRDDACHLSEGDLQTIVGLADAWHRRFYGNAEADHWHTLVEVTKDEIIVRAEREAEEFTCPICGGDMREGGHNIRIDVDDFACYDDGGDYADYRYSAWKDR